MKAIDDALWANLIPVLLLLAALSAALAGWGCDDGPRERDPGSSDAGAGAGGAPDASGPAGDSTLDAPPPAGDASDRPAGDGGASDARGPGDGEADALPSPPDAAIDLPEERCDGLDDDGDGVIDDGVANACGGCGGIPPEGCQAWVVNITQGPDGTTDVNRIVRLGGNPLGFSERAIEGARCQFDRQAATHPDAHLGEVRIDTPLVQLVQRPSFDARSGQQRYVNVPEEPANLRVFDPLSPLSVRGSGGLLVGAFELEGRAPGRLDGVTPADLQPIIDLARGDSDEVAHLTWRPQPEATDRLRLFVGGSVGIFNRNVYKSIRHYSLAAELIDDGALRLTPETLAPAVPGSSIRVSLYRETLTHQVQGPHAIDLVARDRLDEPGGRFSWLDEPEPFQILAPSPNVRQVIPGEALLVRWSELPEGAGPLQVTLLLTDEALQEARQVRCVVTDPARGALELPADVTEGWPMGDGDTRLLDLRWTLRRTPLPGPDRGEIEHAVTVQLRLEAGPG